MSKTVRNAADDGGLPMLVVLGKVKDREIELSDEDESARYSISS